MLIPEDSSILIIPRFSSHSGLALCGEVSEQTKGTLVPVEKSQLYEYIPVLCRSSTDVRPPHLCVGIRVTGVRVRLIQL